MATDPNIAAALRRLSGFVQQLRDQQLLQAAKMTEVESSLKQTRSITDEIDAIPGRRIYYHLVGSADFTAASAGTRGQAVQFLVSQDGAFIQTHYPVAMWLPSAPTNATNFGRWRPIYSWPLPTQEVGGDVIDISWEVIDAGTQRNFQNQAAPPVLSRPDVLLPLPVPTMFAPNATIQFVPTYEAVNFDAASAVPTTGGQLVVALPGYRIVNQ